MFCVVQVLQRKKPDPHGAYRAYEVSSMTIKFPDGTSKTHYSYCPDYKKGRFERDRKETYKISAHESRRENGKVVKKQCVIGTVDYYTLAKWGLYEYIDAGISRAAGMFGADYDVIYKLVETKMQPIIDRIKKEFRKTEEYKAEKQREKVEKAHQKAKKQFAKKYDVYPDEYDCVYNIFGELMDENYMNQIIRQYEQKQEAKRRYRESWRSTYGSYQQSGSSTHGGQSYSSYHFPSVSTYTDADRVILKQFYRSLSKLYHPDLNPDTDTTEQMKMLNKLKEQWGV